MRSVPSLFVLSFVFATIASAQKNVPVTVSDANMVFQQAALNQPGNDMPVRCQLRCSGPNGTNHGYASWWYFRLHGFMNGGGRQYSFVDNGATTTRHASGNCIVTSWSNVDGLNIFAAEMVDLVVGRPGNVGGFVKRRLKITNRMDRHLEISIFHYLDVDVCGTPGGDSVTGPMIHTITDAACQESIRFLPTPDDFMDDEADVFPSLRDRLLPDPRANYNLAGWPGAFNGDYTGAFQWVRVQGAPYRVIPAYGSATFTVYIECGAAPATRLKEHAYGHALPAASGSSYGNAPDITSAGTPFQDGANQRYVQVLLEKGNPVSPALLSIALAPAALAIGDLSVWIDLNTAVSLFTVTDPFGAAVSTLRLPTAPDLVGLGLFSQWFILDPGALRPSHTGGFEVRIGGF